MKLPWNNGKEERIEELEQKLENLEEEKEKIQNQYEAEKDRRSKLSREKQKAQEELNRLKDKVKGLKGKQKEKKESKNTQLNDISYRKAYSLLKKLSTIEDEKEELVTVQSPRKFEGFDRKKDLKNSVGKGTFKELSGRKSFTAFLDEDLGNWLIETRPFFREKMSISRNFETSEMLEFMEREKIWVLLSAGNTKIFRESQGEVEEVEHLKSRIEEKHSKGGFSQGRFERKRKEQISQYMDEVKEFVEGLDEEVFLLGDERFCEKVPGKRLGGFDPNRKRPEQFYGLRLRRF